METALRNVPVMEPEPPEGIVRLNNEWYFDEFAKNGGVGAVGSGTQHQALPASEEKKSILDLFRN
jgi:penicillin-binding protein 1A